MKLIRVRCVFYQCTPFMVFTFSIGLAIAREKRAVKYYVFSYPNTMWHGMQPNTNMSTPKFELHVVQYYTTQAQEGSNSRFLIALLTIFFLHLNCVQWL